MSSGSMSSKEVIFAGIDCFGFEPLSTMVDSGGQVATGRYRLLRPGTNHRFSSG